ncbi:hypothetical protein KDL29_05975 [bacterium]|nr:hypothetical protein [bacterium]
MSRLASSLIVILGLALSLAACNEPDPAEEYAEAMQQMPPRQEPDLLPYLNENPEQEFVPDELAGLPSVRIVPLGEGLCRIRIYRDPGSIPSKHFIHPGAINLVDGQLMEVQGHYEMDDPSPEETRDWTHEDWVKMEDSWTGQFDFRIVEADNGLLAGLLLDHIISNPPENPQINFDYTGEEDFIHLLDMDPRCLFRLEDLQEFSADEWKMATSFHVTKHWKLMTWFDEQELVIGYELISNGRRSTGNWPVEEFPVVYNHVSYDPADPAVPVVISEEEFRIGYDEHTRFRIGNVGGDILAYNFNRDMLVVIRDGKAHTLQLNQGISNLMGNEYIMKTNDVGFGEHGMYILAGDRDSVSILELPHEGIPLDGGVPRLQLLARLLTEDFYGGSINELPEGLLVQSSDGFFLVDIEPMGRTIEADYPLAADAEVAKDGQ